jgi:hypothetical protein
MSLDLTKLTNAVSLVAGVAKRATDAEAALVAAQADVDALAAGLIAAVDTPAEAVGLAAVAEALAAPTAAVADNTTYLPGDPRAPSALG